MGDKFKKETVHIRLPMNMVDMTSKYAHKLNVGRASFLANMVQLGMKQYLNNQAKAIQGFDENL